MVEQITSKKCSKCKEIKPVSEFWKSSYSKDGLKGSCKSCQIMYQRNYRETDRGKAKTKRYYKSEKGKATQKRFFKSEKGRIAKPRYRRKYRQSLKGRITERKYRQRLRKSNNRKPASNLHTERTRKTETSPPDWDKFGDRKPITDENTLTSRQWRVAYVYVENEAKDRPPTFFRRQKTDELIVKLLMLDIIFRQLRYLNIEDMHFSHGEPHINVRLRSGKTRKFFPDPALETKIKAYYDEFRQGADKKKPFLATRNGNRYSRAGIYGKLRGIARRSGVENLSPTIIKRTLRRERRDEKTNQEEKIVLALPLTKFIATHVDLPKDAKGEPKKDEVDKDRKIIKNAHTRRKLNPPLPDPVGGWGGEKHKYNFPISKMRRRWPKWRRIPGLGDLRPLFQLRKVRRNQS